MVLFKRFPRLRPLPNLTQYLIPLDEQKKYSSFDADFATLEDILMPTFRELDNEALKQQNRHRWTYVILIFGGTLATVLGILQIAFASAVWLGVAGALVAAILVVTTAASRSFKHHERYLDTRLASEKLRSAYFLFLGHQHPYEDEQKRVERLRHYVRDIKRRAR